MPAPTTEADIVFNRANVALARSQRLIASWLPPKTEEEIAHTKTDEELQREEDEIFTPTPEKLGLGASLPKSAAEGSANRTELNSNEKLRKQLMGKNYKKIMAQQQATKNLPTPKSNAIQPRGSASQTPVDSDDEEEGRSSLGKKKRKRDPTQDEGAIAGGDVDTEVAGERSGNSAPKTQKARGRKATSYLDELLASRSKKKKKAI